MVLFISMPRRKLSHYLKTHRKRAGFSQEELSLLLSCTSGTKVSRYERNLRLPPLKTALAYEAIFGVPIQELFAGLYEQIEQEVRKQAKTLAQDIYCENADPNTARKLELLRAIIFGPDIIAENS